MNSHSRRHLNRPLISALLGVALAHSVACSSEAEPPSGMAGAAATTSMTAPMPPFAGPPFTGGACDKAGEFKSADGKSCYFLTPDFASWEFSLLACHRWGGSLATINSRAEGMELITINKNAWIGINDKATEGTFMWADGDYSTFTNWATGEPNDHMMNQDCGTFYFLTGTFDDGTCAELQQALCEGNLAQIL